MLARFLNNPPAPTRLYLTRAGPVENPAGVLYSHPGLPLSDEGRTRLATLGEALRPNRPELVVASDSLAEAEAARLLAGIFETSYQLRSELRERSWGEWEGLRFSQVRRTWPREVESWLDDEAGFAPPGGESLYQVEERSLPVIRDLLDSYRGSALLLVGNCTVNRVALKMALPFLPVAEGLRLEQNYAEVTELRFYGADGVLVRLNERPVIKSK